MIKYVVSIIVGFMLANLLADVNYFVVLYGTICFWLGYLVKVNKEE